jgi:hypothetical protein
MARLSWAQAVEVAKRLDPGPGQVVVFSGDGSVLSSWAAQRGVAQWRGEVYACRREQSGSPVAVARLPLEDIEARRDPAFGATW